jgi:hypothetical protein
MKGRIIGTEERRFGKDRFKVKKIEETNTLVSNRFHTH